MWNVPFQKLSKMTGFMICLKSHNGLFKLFTNTTQNTFSESHPMFLFKLRMRIRQIWVEIDIKNLKWINELNKAFFQ